MFHYLLFQINSIGSGLIYCFVSENLGPSNEPEPGREIIYQGRLDLIKNLPAWQADNTGGQLADSQDILS